MIAILDGIAKWAQRTHDVAEIMAEISWPSTCGAPLGRSP